MLQSNCVTIQIIVPSNTVIYYCKFISFRFFVIFHYSFQISIMIDLDMMPPDWKFAINHAKANKPGLVEGLHSKNSSNVFCPCCLKPIIKNEISLFNNSKELQFMGFGFPLYFIFIKYCIILLMILICSYSAISLYWAIHQSQLICSSHRLLSTGQNSHCISMFVKLSRVQPQVSTDELIMRVTSFIIHLFTLLYIRDNILKTMEYYDQKTTSLSDFSLIIKNLPLKDGIQQNIKDFINKHFSQKWEELKQCHTGNQFQQENKVMQITLLPQIEDYYRLVSNKNQIIEQKRQLIVERQKAISSKSNSKDENNSQKLNIIQLKMRNSNQKINLVNKNISEISTLSRSLAKQDKLRSQIAIVILNSQIFKSAVIQYYQEYSLDQERVGEYFGEFQGIIQIQQAPQPNEIIWKNVNASKKKVLLSKVLGWTLSVIFIAIVTVGFYFILIIKTQFLLSAIQETSSEQPTSDNKYTIAVFLVFFDIILIVLFNKLVMGWVLHQFTHLQKHFKTSDEEFSFALKYTLGLFFTTALMTLAVEAITFHNFYSHQYGVVQQQSIMFIINAFLIPFIWLVNPWQIFTVVLRRLKYDKKSLTQRQANSVMSDTPYTMGKRYAEIIQTIWFTFLYASLIPMGSFLTIVGLSIYYWTDKFNLLKRSSLPHNISGQMAVISLQLLDFTLILKPIGQISFDYSIRAGPNIASIVLSCIGFLYLILPIDRILQFFHKQQFQPQQQSFNDVKDSFLETYQTLHPILSFKALKIFANLRNKGKKDISLYEIDVSEIQIDLKQNEKEQYLNEQKNVRLQQTAFNGNTANDLILKTTGDEQQQAQQQFLNYQYRSKKAKNASKHYFSLVKKLHGQN